MLIINIVTGTVIVVMIYFCIDALMHKKYLSAAFNFILAGINALAFYTRNNRHQCKTCGYFVIPPEVAISINTNPASQVFKYGFCLKKMKEGIQIGELRHGKFCWRKPDRIKKFYKEAWEEYLFEHRLETKEW